MTLKPFEPCADYDTERDCTDVILRDTLIVWCGLRYSEVEIGYDADGKLAAVRLFNGDFRERDKAPGIK